MYSGILLALTDWLLTTSFPPHILSIYNFLLCTEILVVALYTVHIPLKILPKMIQALVHVRRYTYLCCTLLHCLPNQRLKSYLIFTFCLPTNTIHYKYCTLYTINTVVYTVQYFFYYIRCHSFLKSKVFHFVPSFISAKERPAVIEKVLL